MAKIKPTNLMFSLILLAVFSFRIWQTTGCKNFTSYFFNPLSIKITAESQTLDDGNLPKNISRFFHNKISVGTSEILKSYANTINIRFLISFLGPLGIFIILAAIGQTIRSRRFYDKLWLVPFLLSFVLILPVDPKVSFYIVAISWYLLAFKGGGSLPESKRLKILLLLLLVMTFWYFSFDWKMPLVCKEIFFN